MRMTMKESRRGGIDQATHRWRVRAPILLEAPSRRKTCAVQIPWTAKRCLQRGDKTSFRLGAYLIQRDPWMELFEHHPSIGYYFEDAQIGNDHVNHALT